jgi:hypothetical protein
LIKPGKMQVLFFLLIPAGVILLVFSIKILRKSFSGSIIVEIPYSQKTAEFKVLKPRHFSIWHKGQFFRKAPLDEFRPRIIDRSTGENIRLHSLLFRPNSNNGRSARMELFRFTAPAGEYILELGEGSSVSGLENSLIGLIPAKKADYDKYFIQVRESQPFLITFLGIALTALSGFLIIGGLVFGILASTNQMD